MRILIANKSGFDESFFCKDARQMKGMVTQAMKSDLYDKFPTPYVIWILSVVVFLNQSLLYCLKENLYMCSIHASVCFGQNYNFLARYPQIVAQLIQ